MLRSFGIFFASVALFGCAPPQGDAYVIDLDPEADFEASPYTGWTRAHYEAVFGRLVHGYANHLSPRKGRAVLPGLEGGWTQVEGVSRMMPAIGAWLSNPENPSVIEVEGQRIDLVELSLQTLHTIQNPDDSERWPALRDVWFQGNVEAAYVAQFLVNTRGRVWDRLSEEDRGRLSRWLTAANAEEEVYSNNWNLFPVMRNVARNQLGLDSDDTSTDAYLDKIDDLYEGDGFYGDGVRPNFDYYQSFVFHPELLHWAWWEGDRDPTRKERIVKRSQAYLHHLPYFFSSTGAAIPFGRSLSYRTAVTAPIAVAVQAGFSPHDPGLDRRMISGNLSFHLGGDTTSTKYMISDENVVTIGYLGETLRVREGYISTGSPYFGTRALQVLALPRDHEFWTATEEPLPADTASFDHVVPAPSFALFGNGPTEPTNLWNGGNHSEVPTYSKLNYSSHFTFSRVQADGQDAYDSALSASPDGDTFWARGPSFDSAVGHGFVYNRSAFDTHGALASQAGVSFGDVLVRASCVDPGVVEGKGPIRLFEGGHPVKVDSVDEEDPESVPYTRVSGGDSLWEYVESSTGHVMIAALYGFDMTVPAHAFKGDDGLNLVHRRSIQPAVATRNPNAQAHCVASLHVSRLAPFDPALERKRLTYLSFNEALRRFSFTIDDEVRAMVSLAVWPDPVVVSVGGHLFEGPVRYARVNSGGERMAATGATEISDDAALHFVSSAGPATVLIDRVEGRIETSAPGYFGAPNVVHVWGLEVGGAWADITGEVMNDGDGLTISPDVWARFATDQELTLATFFFETG
jgi:hypothetical protein